ELDLVGKIGGVIGQRVYVALHSAQLSPRLFGPAHAVGVVGEVEKQASDRDQALAHLGSEVAFFPDRLENFVIASAAIVAAGVRLENVVRDLIDLGTDAFQNVARTINHRVKQVHQYRFPGHGRRANPRELVTDNQ